MKKHWQYVRYMAIHKWFVLVAGLKFKVPLWRLLLHDWIKFRPFTEWMPYCDLFYTPVTHDKRERFQRASFRHVKVNKHHWNYWVGVVASRKESAEQVQLRAFEMPDTYVREMLADWYGAGRAVRGTWSAPDWYAENKDHMMLHDNTRALVEQYLDEIKF